MASVSCGLCIQLISSLFQYLRARSEVGQDIHIKLRLLRSILLQRSDYTLRVLCSGVQPEYVGYETFLLPHKS